VYASFLLLGMGMGVHNAAVMQCTDYLNLQYKVRDSIQQDTRACVTPATAMPQQAIAPRPSFQWLKRGLY